MIDSPLSLLSLFLQIRIEWEIFTDVSHDHVSEKIVSQPAPVVFFHYH